MNKSRIFLALAASVLAISAQAGGIQARDVPRISNGGTGVIGGVEPGAYPYQGQRSQAATASSQDRTMPQAQAQSTRSTVVMGSSAAYSSGGLAPRHQAWGTPD